MAKWLVKSEPDVYSIDDFRRQRVACWDNVRNYEARNNLQKFEVGELVLYYHSNADPAGVVGVAKVAKRAYADPSQFDSKSEYFDPKATKANPRWFSPDLKFVVKFEQVVTLDELRAQPACRDLLLLKRGSRLSVQPVTEKAFDAILQMAGATV